MNMRRILLIVCFIVGFATLRSQTHYVPHIWVGAHAGATLSEVSFTPTVRQKFGTGITGGVSFRYAEERHVGILAEINFAQRGWAEDFEDADFKYHRTLSYISLPVMTHIFFGSRKVKCFVNLGPEIGYMIGENTDADFDYRNPASVTGFPLANRATEQMAMEVKNRFDYGITGGLGVEFVVKRIHSIYLEGRYYFGLGNIYPSSKKDIFSSSRNTTIAITLGYHFRLK